MNTIHTGSTPTAILDNNTLRTKGLKILFLIITILTNSLGSITASENWECLKELDKEVLRANVYIAKQDSEISRLKGNLKVASTSTDKYLSLKQLGMAYSKFCSDSALFYFKKCQELGTSMNNKEWYQEACIEEVFICADRGDDFSATSILSKLGTINDIYPMLKANYAKASLLRFIKYQTSLNNDSATLEDSYRLWKELSSYLHKDEPITYLFYIYYVPNIDIKSTETTMRRLVKKCKPYSYDSAIANLVLYEILKREGKNEEALHALVKSAVADIRNANRSSSSLMHIIELLYAESCSYNSLQNYVKLCMNNVANYKDLGRCIKLIEVQQKMESLQAAQNNHRQVIFLGSLAILVIVCTCLVLSLLIIKKHTKNKDAKYLMQQNQLVELTSKLNNCQNSLLQCTNNTRKQHLKDVYSDMMLAKSINLWSSILKDERLFKKEVSGLLQTGMHRKAKEVVNKAIFMDQSLSKMFAWFDEIYLSLHPNFVDQMNEIMREDALFMPEEKRHLTPELRIYALVSLGLNDTATIADILHYSAQTVYNYRSKVSHCTKIPKFDLNEYVSKLYNEG